MKSFEATLPAGYREVFTIDAADKKIGLRLNIVAAIVMAAIIAPAWLIIRPGKFDPSRFSSVLLTLAAMAFYMVLHELTHGAAYKLLTRQKLKFGVTLTVAYCGVPDIYVYRRTALISLLAPFVVFTLLFGGLTLGLRDPWSKLLCAILLGIHVGGCAGDLYDTWLFLTRFRDPRTLMRDTGPKQTFYAPETEHGQS